MILLSLYAAIRSYSVFLVGLSSSLNKTVDPGINISLHLPVLGT